MGFTLFQCKHVTTCQQRQGRWLQASKHWISTSILKIGECPICALPLHGFSSVRQVHFNTVLIFICLQIHSLKHSSFPEVSINCKTEVILSLISKWYLDTYIDRLLLSMHVFKLSEVGNPSVQNCISEEAFIIRVKQLCGSWRIIKSLSSPRMLNVCVLELWTGNIVKINNKN